MRSIGKSLASAGLLALAGCAGTSTDGGSGDRGATHRTEQGIIGRGAVDGAKLTFGQTVGGDTVYFDYDKTTLRPDTMPTLQLIAEWMKQHPDVQVRVAGHADERGTREYNLALGDRRAGTVRTYLVALGVPAQRLETVSYGKERPVAVGSDEESWAKNRRAVAEIE